MIKPGQLRLWEDTERLDVAYRGKSFLILQLDPDFDGEPFWEILINGKIRLFSGKTIELGSEVIDESR